MARAGGGRLAAAVSNAGGLGLIGGGYADPEWTIAELDEAGSAAVGVGFITWALESQPDLLDEVLARTPRAVMLSFGDPRDLGARVRAAGVPLICQVNDRADALLALAMWWSRRALRPAVTASTGGGTFTLVPKLVDLLAQESPDTLLCAAGGIADGRGLAAALMLGADGVLVGSRCGRPKRPWLRPPSSGTAAMTNSGPRRALLASSGSRPTRRAIPTARA